MKNYVISLKSATHRREHIVKEFGKQNIEFEFFNAITPDQISDISKKLAINLTDNKRLSNGEKGCFLSHVFLWQKILDERIKYAAIFEDDIFLGQCADKFFNSHEYLQQVNIDFLKTETFLQRRKLGRIKVGLDDKRFASCLNEYHLGTAGYILSYKAASSLLDALRTIDLADYTFAIDQFMFDTYLHLNNSLPIFQLCPAIVAQEFILYPSKISMPSDIAQARETNLQCKPKRKISQKVTGELHNAYRKTLGKLNRTMIDFK